MGIPFKIDPKLVKEINILGLNGRMLHIPSRKSKTIVLIHGQHACLERYHALAQYFADFGEVYGPDLPGFGGMDSFYLINKKPSYDNYADYIYTLIKSLNTKNKITLVGMSFGSQVMTRTLQKYPELSHQVENVIAIAGFSAGSDFTVPRHFWFTYIPVAYIGSSYIGNKIIELILLNPISLRILVWAISHKRTNMKLETKYKNEAVELEGHLWKVNDNRTHCATTVSMFKGDLRIYKSKLIDKQVFNVISKKDQYFKTEHVKQTFLQLYKSYRDDYLKVDVHAPSILANKEEVHAMMPMSLTETLKD